VQNDLAVLSPEKTIITYRLSGIGSRILAHLLDLMIVGVADGVIVAFALGMISVVDETIAQVVVMFTFSFSLFIYFILMEGFWSGQTLGKKALGIRVRMADGLPVTFSAALARNLMRPADMFPPITYFMGLLAMFCTPKSQRFGDMIANTVVTHERRAVPYFTPAPHSAGVHPLEHHVGELRGMTIEEYNALRRFADRFPELPTSVQERLVHEVYRPIALRRGIQPIANVHALYLAEAAVMKYGREHGLL
jgi:uncharacterized RDD family membrane protein YckC